MRFQNKLVEAVDELTQFRHETASLSELAELASNNGYPEMAQTLREYAQKGTR